jgi:hypothetical protein
MTLEDNQVQGLFKEGSIYNCMAACIPPRHILHILVSQKKNTTHPYLYLLSSASSRTIGVGGLYQGHTTEATMSKIHGCEASEIHNVQFCGR